jgi:hypothetical protein
MRVQCHATLVAAVLVVSAGAGASAAVAQQPSTGGAAVDCSQVPTPAGCVTAIAFADPATVHMTRGADGVTQMTWSTDGEQVEPLATPVTIAQAAKIAASESAARGLVFSAPQGDAVSPATARAAARMRSAGRARARQFAARAKLRWSYISTVCSTDAYPPWRVVIDSYWSHLHIASDQTCYGDISQNWVDVHEHRDGTYMGGSSGVAFGSAAPASAATYVNCHEAGDHLWDNWTHLYLYDSAGIYHSGPMGVLAPAVSYRCY